MLVIRAAKTESLFDLVLAEFQLKNGGAEFGDCVGESLQLIEFV